MPTDAPGALFLSAAMAETHRAALDRIAPDTPRVLLRDGIVEGDPATITIANFSGDTWPDHTREYMLAVLAAPHLRWLHTFSAGVDHPVFASFLERGVRLTTSSGAGAVPIAQTVLLYVLALSRNLRGWLDAQRRHEWAPHDIQDLQGRVLGVVGLGPIGLETARLGVALRMRVIGLRRTPRGDEPCETWPLERLPDLLPLADHLVLALPLTDGTRGLIDAAALARLRPEATLINVGRGELVDEDALVTALQTGRLAGAALDVFAVEPLPSESPLWDLPNVILTPHGAGKTPANYERANQVFLENLARWRRGAPLVNEVLRTD